ncbi:MAG: hypothetical protein PQJ49_13230 [Sphaerochaetaceae bacterium]|nr:hypothetical protein [Sphaerochaetaceae bacterium]
MKKKLITILAMLAIGATFVFAADGAQQAGVGAGPDFTAASITAPGDDTATVVVVAPAVDFSFDFEALNNNAWVSANGTEVYNTDWSPRADFTAEFRIRVLAGSDVEDHTLGVTVTAGALTRVEDASVTSPYVSDSSPAVSDLSLSTTSTILSLSDNTILLSSTEIFGTTGEEDANSAYFDVSYTGDVNAPAGQYKSTVTVAYTAS